MTDPAHEPPPAAALRWTAAAVLAAGVAVVAAAAVAVGTFALPAFDDFMRATRRGQSRADLGWWGYVFGFTYHRWQGRWASCGLEAAVLPHLDMVRRYPLLIAAVAAADAVAAYAVVRGLTRAGPRRLAAAVTAGLLAVLWAGLPSLPEAVYWFVGAVENTLPIAAAAALVAALALSDRRLPPPAVAALAVAAVATAGLHELYGAVLCLALAVGTATAFTTRSDRRWAWLAVTAAAAAGLAVVVAAPGNRVRMTAEVRPPGRQLLPVLRIAAAQAWPARAWLLDPKLLAATAWVTLSPALEAARRPWPSAARVPWRAVLPATAAAAVAAGFVLPSWAFAAPMPARTLSGVYVVAVVGWLLTAYAWTRPLSRPPTAPGTYRRPAAQVAAAALGVSLVLTGSVHSAAADLSHRLRPWHAAAERRFAQLRRSAGSAAAVPRLPPPPYLILNGEVVDDPADYRNRGPVAYFALTRLTVQPAPPAP